MYGPRRGRDVWERRDFEQDMAEARLVPTILKRYEELEFGTDAEATALKLSEALAWASSRVPYYRDLGLASQDRVELSTWPTITRRQLSEDMLQFTTDLLDPDTCELIETSGTTGQSIRVVHDAPMLSMALAALEYRYNSIYGSWGPARRILKPFSRSQRWFTHVSPGQFFSIIAHTYLPPDRDGASRLAAQIKYFEPEVVIATPGTLLDLASEGCLPPTSLLLVQGVEFPQSERALLSEMLPQAKVRSAYGLKEVLGVAFECSAGAMHVSDERVIVEVLELDRDAPTAPGCAGEITVTELYNRAMPVLRYRTGDTAVLHREPCACGQPGVWLSEIRGRVAKWLTGLNGETVQGYYLSRLVNSFSRGRQTQIQHVERGIVQLVVVGATAEENETLLDSASSLLGSGFRVRVSSAAQSLITSPSGGKVPGFVV